MNSTTKKIIDLLLTFDTKGASNECLELIQKRITAIVQKNEPLVLSIFTCSTINANQMFSNTPWVYVSLDPAGNNLTNDIKQVGEILRALRKIYPPTTLRILIGNTDPYYIYTQQFSVFQDLSSQELWVRFSERWEIYRKNITQWTHKQLPDIPTEVISWYAFEKEIEKKTGIYFEKEFEKFLSNASAYINPTDAAWELAQLQKQFAPGKYFEGLTQPSEAVLRDWITRKFAEYAVQATWIRTYMPNTLLIQNEKPSDLRTAMYQPLVREQLKEPFPILYLLGLDNEGYQ